MYLCRTKFSNIKRFFPASPIFLHRHHNLHIIFDDKEPLSRHSCFMHDFWQGVVLVVQRNPIIFQDIYCCSSYSKEGTFVSSFTLCSLNSVFLRHDSIFEIHRNIRILSEFPFFYGLQFSSGTNIIPSLLVRSMEFICTSVEILLVV